MMAHFWQTVQTFFLGLGTKYGVNPWIFGAIYVGAIPFFTASVAWLVRSVRRKRPLLPPLLSAGFFFISAYLYLIAVGRNVPAWAWCLIGGMVVLGGVGAARKIWKRLE